MDLESICLLALNSKITCYYPSLSLLCNYVGSLARKVCSSARIHTERSCVGGEVWEVVVEADMCRRAVVGMVD